MSKPLYFDHNATTPIAPEVFEAMRPYLTEKFGNPGCIHNWGADARDALAEARAQLAGLLNCEPGEILFTSGATESNNMVLLGVFAGRTGGRLVTSKVEHPAVVEPAKVLEKRGVEIAWLDVDKEGVVSMAQLAEQGQGADLVSLMLANNETGVLQPVARAGEWRRGKKTLLHSDGSQAVGKIPVDVQSLGVDFLTVAGHKMYAPKGVGALYCRQGTELPPRVYGGGQEGGIRPGTENIPYIVALGAAAALAARGLEAEAARQRGLGEQFLQGLGELGRDFIVHGHNAPRLPNTMSVGFREYPVGDILSGLVARDVGASAGAACHSGAVTLSSVLAAMGAPLDYAAGTIRFSWGRSTTSEDVAELIGRLAEVFAELDAW